MNDNIKIQVEVKVLENKNIQATSSGTSASYLLGEEDKFLNANYIADDNNIPIMNNIEIAIQKNLKNQHYYMEKDLLNYKLERFQEAANSIKNNFFMSLFSS